MRRQFTTHATRSTAHSSRRSVGTISPHCGRARGRGSIVAGAYGVVAHAGLAVLPGIVKHLGVVGLLCRLKNSDLASSFGRMSSAWRYSQGSHCGSDAFVAEPEFPHCLDRTGAFLSRGFRYPVIGSDHVVGVGVVAQVFEQVADQGRRVFVLSHATGQGPKLKPRWNLHLWGDED